MLKWICPALLILGSIGLFVAGAAYGVVMVGVPGPDSSSAVVAQERRDMEIAGGMMLTSVLTGLAGTAWLGITLVVWLVRRSRIPHCGRPT